MSALAQGKILHAIEEKHFRRVGGERLTDANVRIISATNRDLKERMAGNQFREDLYYRLKEVSLYLPPLRERKEDIPLLISYFVQHYGGMYGKPKLGISKTALNYLTQYSWPGNIRELENVVKSAVILCADDMLWLEHFPFEMRLKTEFDRRGVEDFTVDSIVKNHILHTLEYFCWNKKRAASALGISRPRLDRQIKRFGLENQDD